MAQVKGKKSTRVPFPQFDYPGSKISPFTGKPYTAEQAQKTHSKTRVAQARKLSNQHKFSQGAIERRLKPKTAKGPVEPPKFIRDFVKAAKPKDMIAPPNILKALKPKSGAKKHAGWEALENKTKKKSQPKRSTSTRGGFRE